MKPAVSLVTTVRDEAASIDGFLRSVLAQTRVPDEVVIVDGGSRDDTVARILALRTRITAPRIHVLRAPGANISQGRNIAIARAAGPIVAVTDAGTELAPDWLECIVRPLETDAQLAVSAGFFEPAGATPFERCLAVLITPQLPEIEPERFLPSSRSVAFRKEWWLRVGGYPEWLRHCEDLVFDLALERAGARFAFAPDARVGWHARPSLGRFFRQYFDYARGDGHAHLWPARHAARYTAYAAGALLLAATLMTASAPGAPLSLLPASLLAAGVAAHFRRFARRAWRLRKSRGARETAATLALLPAVVIAGDLAKMIGYAVGRYERARAGGPERLRTAAPATIEELR